MIPHPALDPLEPGMVAVGFAAWVPPISALLGPPPTGPTGGHGTPDGWAGHTRRGPLHRLTPSSAALLHLAPAEFYRRWSDGELLFTEPATPPDPAAAGTLLLLDAGPDQLGSPRLVHLLVWLLLRHRGDLRWGVLQDPAGTWRDGGLPRGLADLRDARRATRATDDDLLAWTASAPASSERWLLTAPPRIARGWRALHIERAGDEVRVTRPDRGHAIHLPLPHPVLQRRLLRGSPRPAAPPEGPLRWSSDGRTLFVRTRHHLLGWRLRHGHGRAPAPRPPLALGQHPMVGVDDNFGDLVTVRRADGRLLVTSDRGSHEITVPHEMILGSGMLPVVGQRYGPPFLLDRAQQVWSLDVTPTLWRTDRDVVALRHTARGSHTFVLRGGGSLVVHLGARRHGHRRPVATSPDGLHWTLGLSPAFAGDLTEQVPARDATGPIASPAGHDVLGVIHVPGSPPDAIALVTHVRGDPQLWLVRSFGRRQRWHHLHVAPRQVLVSPHAPWVAAWLTDGRVVALHTHHDALRHELHTLPEGEA